MRHPIRVSVSPGSPSSLDALRSSLSPLTLIGVLALWGASGCASESGARRPAQPPEPSAAHAGAKNDADFRNVPPPVPAPPELTLPQFKKADLDNGLTVLVSERHSHPVVDVQIAFAAGSASDPPGFGGTAALTYGLLLEGAGGYDELGLAKALSALGATPGVEVNADGARIGVSVLTERAEPALALLAEVVMHPQLSEAGFARRKAQQLANLSVLANEPGYVAQRAFLAVAYGRGHPYAHPRQGTPDSVEAVDLRTVRAFYGAHVGPTAAALILTGDITLPQAVALAKRYLGAWHAPAQIIPPPPAVAVVPGSPIFTIARAGLDQTTLLLGRPTVAAGDPDEAPLEIATAAFGGMFSSRLNLDLREGHGYAYGASAQLDARRGAGPWLATAAVRGDVTASALTSMLDDLGKLPVEPFTQAETDAARRSLVAALPGQFESADQLAAAAARLFWGNLPLDRYERLVAALDAAAAADVEEVALRYLRPGLVNIIAVGDPKMLSAQLSGIQLDPAREIAAWGTQAD